MRLVIIFIIFFIHIELSIAGVVVGSTRVIYNTSKGSADVSVKNTQKDVSFLIQSWIENPHDSIPPSPALVVTPPLFKLNPEQENIIRIVPVKNTFPTDRESIYWLNIKSISPTQQVAVNQLQISIKTRIKIFIRPNNLTSDEAEIAYKHLEFKRKGGQLVIKNPTPYYVSFFSIRIDNHLEKHIQMVEPLSTTTFTSGSGKKITWNSINDFGGVTKEMHSTL